MNKLLLTLLTTAAMVTASAADYQYLTFEMTDGTKASVEAANLSLIFDGTTLKVGKELFTLTNLTKMYFSTGDETTGISQIENGEFFDEQSGKAERKFDNSTEFFDLKGNRVSKDQIRKGIYIVKTKNGTAKLTVR
jgi:hypothetical protein